MSWQPVWKGKRKKEQPNRLRSKPTISFRSNLGPEVLRHIKKLALQKEKSRFINKAIEMRYFYETCPKGFLVQMIQHNFSFCKHLLRQIGSSFKLNQEKC